jgi:hypothetical protein
MFNALYPEDTDAAIDAQMRRPPAAPAPVPWFRGAWRAIGQAVPRAGAEMGRTGTALLTPEAVGAMDAPTMFSAPGKTSKPQLADEIREQDRALADSIKEFTPDPNTTGAASMVLHDVTKFVGKAAAYSALGGTPLAVGGMALDEGTNEALRRMDEGVDAATAAKLGVTKGIASGVAVALPVAGKTLAQTLGLAAFGGPGSYIAEQTVAKHILETAGYDEQAAQVDPFDPLGLGVSFFGSLFFGAGVHGARRVKARSDARAADERMLADSRPPGEPTQVAQAVARAYTPEQVDAAHVSLLQAQREGSALHAREDIAAGGRHAEALDRASEQLASGQRVEVGDVAPVDGARIAAEAAALSARVARSLELFHGTKDPLVTVDTLSRSHDIGPHFTTARATAELFANSEGTPGRVLEARGNFTNPLELPDLDGWFPTKLAAAIDEVHGIAAAADDQTPLQARVWDVMEAVRKEFLDQQPEWYQKARNEFGDKPPEQVAREKEIQTTASAKANEAGYQVLREHLAEQGYDAIKYINRSEGEPVDTYIALDRSKVRDAQDASAKSAAPEAATAAPDASNTDGSTITGAQPDAAPSADYAAREADTIAQANPDMLVMMEGMEAPVRAADLLAEAKAMEAQELADSPLLRVAAECALRG